MGDIQKVVVISDTHCGSTVGLLPPGCVSIEGNMLTLNEHQQWIWDKWVDFTQHWLPEMVGDSEFALVINGDVFEGNHHHSTQLMTPDPADQWGIACKALDPLIEWADKSFVVVGTECHTRNMEHAIAEHFGSVKASNNRGAWDRLDMDVNGCVVRFVHHISTTSRVHLRASRLSIHLANMQLEALRAKHPIPQVLCAGHCHVYDEYTDSVGMCITGPSWQTLTRYGYKVVSNAVPSVGGYVLDWTECEPGELPNCYARVYRPEHTGVVRL